MLLQWQPSGFPTIRAIWLTYLLNRCRWIKAGIPQADLPLNRNELHYPYTGYKSLICGQLYILHQERNCTSLNSVTDLKYHRVPGIVLPCQSLFFCWPSYLPIFKWVQTPKFKVIYQTIKWCKGIPHFSMKVSEDSWRSKILSHWNVINFSIWGACRTM